MSTLSQAACTRTNADFKRLHAKGIHQHVQLVPGHTQLVACQQREPAFAAALGAVRSAARPAQEEAWRPARLAGLQARAGYSQEHHAHVCHPLLQFYS